MSKTFISSSGNSIDKAIDKYHDTTSYSGSNSSTSNSSSGGNTIDEEEGSLWVSSWHLDECPSI